MNESLKWNIHSSNDEFSRFLFDLYAAASRVAVDEFRPEAFRLLDRLLNIDSAWWGTGLHKKQRLLVAQASLYKLEASFVPDFIQVIDQDPLVQELDQSEGQVVMWNDGGLNGSPAMNAFDNKYGLRFGITSAQKDPASGVGMFMSVFRNGQRAEFNEAERQLMQSAVGHLVQAWSINLRLALASESSTQIPNACLVDLNGHIVEISPVFAAKLHAEFPEWDGNVLPEKLRRLFGTGNREVFRGKSINIWNEKTTGKQIRLQCGQIRPSALTPREEAVALAFAKGNSYKEIATSLNLSPGTVRSYLTQCYSKLDVKNKIELGIALGKKSRTAHS